MTGGIHLQNMLGRIVEVYVDDIVVKSDFCQHQIKYLQEVLQALRNHGIRLNHGRKEVLRFYAHSSWHRSKS